MYAYIYTDNGFSWTVKIPSSLAPGSYVLRHEIIGLHSAGSSNGAQNYPQVSSVFPPRKFPWLTIPVHQPSGQRLRLYRAGWNSGHLALQEQRREYCHCRMHIGIATDIIY